jgi:hypothetical protein
MLNQQSKERTSLARGLLPTSLWARTKGTQDVNHLFQTTKETYGDLLIDMVS